MKIFLSFIVLTLLATPDYGQTPAKPCRARTGYPTAKSTADMDHNRISMTSIRKTGEKSLGKSVPEQIEIAAQDFDPENMDTVFIFSGHNCPECSHMRLMLAPKLLEAHGISVGHVALLDLDIPENMLFLANLEEKLGTEGTETPVVYFRGKMYYGRNELEKAFSDSSGIAMPPVKNVDAPNDAPEVMYSYGAMKRKAQKITIGVIAVAGLIDGLNPCVFSGLVFLASLLASSRLGGRRLLLTGGAYCLGSFLCYSLMGLGLLGILDSLLGGGGLPRTILNCAIAALLCVLSLLSFRDAAIYRRSGNGEATLLKLPAPLRDRIRNLIRLGAGSGFLLAGGFFSGAVVTAIESACTGQIYVPALAFMLKTEGTFSVWLGYLLLYNVMFIAPLVGLLAGVYFGMKSLRLASMSRLDAFAGKMLMGVLFAILAVLMILF